MTDPMGLATTLYGNRNACFIWKGFHTITQALSPIHKPYNSKINPADVFFSLEQDFETYLSLTPTHTDIALGHNTRVTQVPCLCQMAWFE